MGWVYRTYVYLVLFRQFWNWNTFKNNLSYNWNNQNQQFVKFDLQSSIETASLRGKREIRVLPTKKLGENYKSYNS